MWKFTFYIIILIELNQKRTCGEVGNECFSTHLIYWSKFILGGSS